MRPARARTRREAVHLAIARGKLALARVDGHGPVVDELEARIAELEAALGLAPGEDPAGGSVDPVDRANAWMPYKES